MPEEFIWRPRIESPGSSRFRRLVAQFGDGYKQSAANGIKNKYSSWDLTFIGTNSQIQEISDFLDLHQGTRSFYFVPTSGARALFLASDYVKTKIGYRLMSLTVTFEETSRP